MAGEGDGAGQQVLAGEPEPDASRRAGSCRPEDSQVDAIFVLAGAALGIGRTERVTPPVWLNLDELVNLDAIGDPVDGLTAVEIAMEDHQVIAAGWPKDFCNAVVEALQRTTRRFGRRRAHRPEEAPHLVEAARSQSMLHQRRPRRPWSPRCRWSLLRLRSPLRPWTNRSISRPTWPSPSLRPCRPRPRRSPPIDPPTRRPCPTLRPDPPAASLELEDVVYLGGYPGQSKRRKRCVVGMTNTGLELRGGGDLHFRLGWDVVRTIEVQNSDEARFRMNTRIHRDASALVVECEQGVTLLFEARDCPTIALRSAIGQLLADVPVAVV